MARAVGIAITFVDLKEADRVVLDRLVASRLRDAVPAKLRVGGVPHDLRCEAVVGERTMHVSTSLPSFLRQGADVGLGVSLDDHRDVEARGIISRISLDPSSSDGAPRLALDVDIGGPEGAPATGGPDEDAPPTALPRPYGHPLPSVLLSRRYARAPHERRPRTAATRPRAPARHGRAAPPSGRRRRAARPPRARELTLRMFALAARPPARAPSAYWLAVPLLLIEAALFLLTRLGR